MAKLQSQQKAGLVAVILILMFIPVYIQVFLNQQKDPVSIGNSTPAVTEQMEISLGVVGPQNAGETPHVAFFSNTHPLRFTIQLQLLDKDGKEMFIERLSATYNETAKQWVDFYLVTGSEERGLDGRSYDKPTAVDLERLNEARTKYLDLLANERK